MINHKWTFVAAVAVAALMTLTSPAAVRAQDPDPATQLYVRDMGVTAMSVGGPRRLAVAVVDIVDGNGVPVNGAMVVGNWSGCFREKADSGLTQTYYYTDIDGTVIEVDGRAEVWAGKSYSCWGAKQECYFTFTITGVFKNGMTYVPVDGFGTSWSASPCQ